MVSDVDLLHSVEEAKNSVAAGRVRGIIHQAAIFASNHQAEKENDEEDKNCTGKN
jgi:hypothetical protein